MSPCAYITRMSGYLPNEPVANDRMEESLGKINGRASRARKIVLKNNGIRSRHYALDGEGRFTHTNAELAAQAVRGLFSPSFSLEDMELLCCATTIADQLIPSHAAMVQGCLGGPDIEIASLAGVCCSGMIAMKYGMMSIVSGNTINAVCTASELASAMFLARNYTKEISEREKLESRPILAFEKDFLRWMLSDGAGAALLQSQPERADGISLRIDWIDTCSFAGEVEVCMYAGAEKDEDGRLVGWSIQSPSTWLDRSIFSIKQDVSILERHIIGLGVRKLAEALRRHSLPSEEIDFFLPHLSSEYFREPLEQKLKEQDIPIPREKWFTNLVRVGNVGSASIYLMLEELFSSGRLERGMRVLCLVPESARFSYAIMLLTVC